MHKLRACLFAHADYKRIQLFSRIYNYVDDPPLRRWCFLLIFNNKTARHLFGVDISILALHDALLRSGVLRCAFANDTTTCAHISNIFSHCSIHSSRLVCIMHHIQSHQFVQHAADTSCFEWICKVRFFISAIYRFRHPYLKTNSDFATRIMFTPVCDWSARLQRKNKLVTHIDIEYFAHGVFLQ